MRMGERSYWARGGGMGIMMRFVRVVTAMRIDSSAALPLGLWNLDICLKGEICALYKKVMAQTSPEELAAS